MAENKTSFVLYSDSKSIIDLLTNEQAGLLLKTLFAYVNDENPKIDNSIALVFEMIKLQLKRDLKKWEQTKEGRSAAGKGAAPVIQPSEASANAGASFYGKNSRVNRLAHRKPVRSATSAAGMV